MRRYAVFICFVLFAGLLGWLAMLHYQDRHEVTVAGISQADFDALAQRVDELEPAAPYDDADVWSEIGWNEDAISALSDQIAGLEATVSGMQGAVASEGLDAERLNAIDEQIQKLWTARERNRRRICLIENQDHIQKFHKPKTESDLRRSQAEHCGPS